LETILKEEDNTVQFKVPLTLSPQPEGGYTVTSPVLPELITEGDDAAEAIENAKDALAAVVELYQDLGRPLPTETIIDDLKAPLSFDMVVSTQ
jgi:antitoxin HicB